jgi:hypothetical protein
MKNLFKSAALAITLTMATTEAFSASAGDTLLDLQAVTTTYTQTTLDIAARLLMDESLITAYAGTYTPAPTNLDTAVIFQLGTSDFAYIGQDTAGAANGNYASIEQLALGTKNNAYITQSGTTNYASIQQSSVLGAVAYISQVGSASRALINQQ